MRCSQWTVLFAGLQTVFQIFLMAATTRFVKSDQIIPKYSPLTLASLSDLLTKGSTNSLELLEICNLLGFGQFAKDLTKVDSNEEDYFAKVCAEEVEIECEVGFLAVTIQGEVPIYRERKAFGFDQKFRQMKRRKLNIKARV